jgi:hypothetical protein
MPTLTPPTDSSSTTDTSATDSTDSTGAGVPTVTPLVDQVDTYWHYAKIARWDLAADAGKQLLASTAAPEDFLKAFETVAEKKGDDIDSSLSKWKSLPVPSDAEIAEVPSEKSEQESIVDMRKVSSDIADRLNEGYATRRSNPDYIIATINEMSTGSRAYDNNLPRLAKSGELAVKVCVDILRNPDQRELNSTARRILRDLGRTALAPLYAATEMKDPDTLVDICSALGDIGYDSTVPYLSRLLHDPSQADEVHIAARNGLLHMGIGDPESIDTADQYYTLAEKFYYGTSSVKPSGDKTAYVWYWREDRGLTKLDVPTPAFGDVMAMRAAEYTLKIDPSRGHAVGLWLAANTKREADLPPGTTDPTHRGDPDAHYYDVSSGVSYLNDALGRALHDRDAAVALKLTHAMQEIIGEDSIVGSEGEPVIQALFFPHRLVRYEAAFALAEAMPTQPFSGSDRVAPLLVEAMNQTARPNILAVAPAGKIDDIRDALKGLGYGAVTGTDPTQTANEADALPSIDVILVSEDSDVGTMIALSKNNVRLQEAPVVVLTHIDDSPYKVQSVNDPMLTAAVMPTKDAMQAQLKLAIDAAREHSGIAPLTDEEATRYSLRAADLLQNLALSHGQVINLGVVEPGLLAALNDVRPQIVIASGKVLSFLNSQSAQNALADKANDNATPTDVRVSLYESLAANARFFGNHLNSDQVDALEAVVSDGKQAQVQDAAGEARGALNLPATQAEALIMKQSKM